MLMDIMGQATRVQVASDHIKVLNRDKHITRFFQFSIKKEIGYF